MNKINAVIMLAGLMLLVSCGEKDEFGLKVKLTFVNSTDTNISYSNLFELAPTESYTYEDQTETTSSNPNIETCCNGLLEDFQGGYDQVFLVINEVNCLYFNEGEGPTSLNNFESEKLNSRSFSYTYTLSPASIENMQPCNN